MESHIHIVRYRYLHVKEQINCKFHYKGYLMQLRLFKNIYHAFRHGLGTMAC